MRKIFGILTIINCLAFSSFSQNNGKLSGIIMSSSKPVEAATVTILRASDSSEVKTIASSKSGVFDIEGLAHGKYLVKVSAIGYNATYTTTINLEEQKPIVTLPPIEIVENRKALENVVVTAKKQLIEQKPGKTVLNVDASPSNAGTTALELLEKTPGVSVDKDGAISIRGKQGVMVLLDGKPSYLSGADLVNMLKNMQSSNIEQIEVMTNPPAKYDAAGNSGIINIKTKKINTKGTNGNISANYSQGIYARGNSNINLNHRNNKINIFGTYGINRYQGFNDLTINRRFLKSDKKTLAGSSDQKSLPQFKGIYQNVKAGLDYYLSKKDVVGFVLNGNFNQRTEGPTSLSNIRDAEGDIIYLLRSNSDNSSSFTNLSSNLNYKHTFDSTGREITADVDYLYYNNDNKTLLSTQTLSSTGNQIAPITFLKGIIPSSINIYSVKADYVHPINKTTKLEAGVKSSIVNTNNKVDYFRNAVNGWTADSRSNHFIYNENINAAYAILSKQIKKWNLIAGLRLENTNAKGTQVTTDSTFKRNYTNLFPNVGVGFEASNKHQFNFSYSRRIDRPSYDDLNPFTFFIDSLTYGQGNPYLQPQFTNNLELSHSFNRFLTTTINYNQTDNVLTQLLKQDTEKKVTYQTIENVSKMRQVGLTVSVNKNVTKWWSTNVYMNLINNHYTGFYNADPIDINFTSFGTNINNNFTFNKGWAAEVGGFYRSKGAEGLLIANQMYALNAGVSKQVLQKKGTVRLSIRDILYTQKFSGYARYSDVDIDVSSQRDSRQVTLSFTYRFGKTNFAPAKRKSGALDEQNRVKSGGN